MGLEHELIAEIMRLVAEYRHVDKGVQLSLYYGNDCRWRCDVLVGGNVVLHITLDNLDDYHAACDFLKDTN